MKTSSLPDLPSSRRHRRVVAAVLALATALTLALATPSLATEGAEGAEGEGNGKITMPSNPHDQFGLILFGLMGVGAAAAGVNAVMQLRGRRPQTDGKIRWR